MDIGGFNQSETQISLCSRFALYNKTNIKCSSLCTKKKKGPKDEGDQIS